MPTIKLKRSATQNAVPTTSQLGLGEVALNTYDGKMFIKKSVGGTESIVEIGGDATSSSGIDFTGNLNLADDVRIVIGDGNDLQIYHDGSDSYITDGGTGNLKIQADDLVFKTADGSKEYLKGTASGSVRIRHNNSTKFETTSTGATVTGTLVADGLDLGDDNILNVGTIAVDKVKGDADDNTNITFAGNDVTAFYQGGAEKIRIDADGRLLVNTTSSVDNFAKIQVVGDSSSLARITLQDVDGTNQKTYFEQSNGGTRINTQDGTSHGFFTIGGWNGTSSSDFLRVTSLGRVGIGTVNPEHPLHVSFSGDNGAQIKSTDNHASLYINAGSGYGSYIRFEENNAQNYWINADTNGRLLFRPAGGSSNWITFDSSGRVGIGITSPSTPLAVQSNSSAQGITVLGRSSDDISQLDFAENDGTSIGGFQARTTDFRIRSVQNLPLLFMTNNTERVRVDTSGNLLVGTTNTVPGVGNTTAGISLYNDGRIFASKSGNTTMSLNRNTSDGNLLEFRRDGNQKGSIGVQGDRIYLTGANEAVGIDDSWNAFVPLDTGGGNSNADTDLGNPSSRWKDLYLSGQVNTGTISSGNITTTGYLRGPSTFTIDPAAHGDNTGTVVIAGNLQVDGTTTTINSTTLTVDDKNITLASGSTNAAAANGAGLTVDCGSDTDATFSYQNTGDRWTLNKPLHWTYATATTALSLNNNNIVGVNNIAFADAGANEGLQWSNIRIFESPNDLTNASGNFQVTYGATRRLTVDNTGIQVNGNIANVSGDMTLDVAGDIILDADGGDIRLADSGTQFGKLSNNGTDLVIESLVSNRDIVFKGADGSSVINALILDMSDGGGAYFNNDIYVVDSQAVRFGTDQDFRISSDGSNTYLVNSVLNQDIYVQGRDSSALYNMLIMDMSARKSTFAGIVSNPTGFEVGNMFIMPNEIDVSSGSLTLDVADRIILDASTDGDIRLHDDGLFYGQLFHSGNNLYIRSRISDGDIIFNGQDGSSFIDALRLDMSTGGTAFFADDVRLTDNHAVRLGTDGDIVFYHDNSNGYLENGSGNFIVDSAGDIILDAAGNDVILKDAGTTFGQLTNDSGNLVIYNSGSQMLKGLGVGSNAQFMGSVGIGTSSPTDLLTVAGTIAQYNSYNDAAKFLGNKLVTDSGSQSYTHPYLDMRRWTGSAANHYVASIELAPTNADAGSIVFYSDTKSSNTKATTERMRINSSGRVGIGTAAPGRTFHVASSDYSVARLERTGAGGGVALEFRNGDGNIWQIGNDGDEVLRFYYAGTNRLQITSTGATRINSAYTLPTADGSANQVLKTDGSGNLSFVTIAGAGAITEIEDADGDTKIQVEESSDEDVIRFDTAGTERARIGVDASSDSTLEIVRSGVPAASGKITFNGSGLITDATSGYHGLIVRTGGTERARFNAAGGLSIGTTTVPPNGGLLVDNDIKGNSRIGVGSGGNLSDAAIYKNSDTNTGIIWPAADTLAFTTGGGERVRINGNGVGIGEANIDANLHITHTNPNLKFEIAGQGKWAIGMPAGQTYLAFDETNDALSTPTMVMTKTTKRVGIGTTAPSAPLHVVGADSGIKISSDASDRPHLSLVNGTSEMLRLSANNVYGAIGDSTDSQRYMTFVNGSIGIGTTNPGAKVAIVKSTNATNGVIIQNGTTGTAARSNLRLLSDAAQLDIYATSSTYSGVSSWADAGVISTSSNASGGLIFNAQATGHIFQTSTTERMRIDSSGKLLLNATSSTPSDKFYVNGDAYATGGFRVGTAATFIGEITHDSGKLRIQTAANRDILLGDTANPDIVFIDTSTQKVGIGTTSPETKLDVNVDSNSAYTSAMSGAPSYTPSTSDIIQVRNTESGVDDIYAGIWFETGNPATNTSGTDRSGRIALVVDNSNAYSSNFVFQTRTSSGTLTEKMRITNDGNVGIGTTSPESHLHIKDIADATLIVEADSNNSGETDNARIELRQDGNNVAGYLYTEGNAGQTATGTLANTTVLESKGAGNDVGIHFATGGRAPAQSGGELAGTVRMTVLGNGNVGIGLNNPSHRLQVSVDANGAFIKRDVASNAANLSEFNSHRSLLLLNRNAGSYLAFGGNSSRTDIQATDLAGTPTAKNITLNPFGGNVGIGTDSPAYKFHAYHPTTNVVGRFESGDSQVWIDLHDSNSGTYGALLGHDSNAGQLFMVADQGVNRRFIIDTAGQVSIGTNVNPVARLQVEALGIDTTTTSTTATTQVAIDTMAAATFRSAEFTIQVTNSTDSTYHLTKVLLIHDGTTPGITEYGTVFTGSAAEATFDADISSGNVRLLATPASTDSMTFKVVRHCITV